MKKSKTIFAITALSVGLGAANIASANIFKEYTLKGAAPTGTKIKTVDAKSSLPFDKRYFELSAAEKEFFRSKYTNISSNVIPPFPKAGLKAIYKPIIEQAKKGKTRGRLSMKVMVNENGEVTDLTVLETPHKAISKASQRILMNTQFDPGFCSGQPCAMEFPVSIKFN